MRARFESDVGGGALGGGGGGTQGHDFGVGIAGALGAALADRDTVSGDDHAANARIGLGEPDSTHGQRQRRFGVALSRGTGSVDAHSIGISGAGFDTAVSKVTRRPESQSTSLLSNCEQPNDSCAMLAG